MTPVHMLLIGAAVLLFAGSALLWAPPVEPYRIRFIGGGLMCLALTLLF
jgi:hypothetical protein